MAIYVLLEAPFESAMARGSFPESWLRQLMLENKCSQIDYTRKTSKREGKNRSKKVEKTWKDGRMKGKMSKRKPLNLLKFSGFLVRHEGLEPPTFAFVVRDSIQLS